MAKSLSTLFRLFLVSVYLSQSIWTLGNINYYQELLKICLMKANERLLARAHSPKTAVYFVGKLIIEIQWQTKSREDPMKWLLPLTGNIRGDHIIYPSFNRRAIKQSWSLTSSGGTANVTLIGRFNLFLYWCSNSIGLYSMDFHCLLSTITPYVQTKIVAINQWHRTGDNIPVAK